MTVWTHGLNFCRNEGLVASSVEGVWGSVFVVLDEVSHVVEFLWTLPAVVWVCFKWEHIVWEVPEEYIL